MEQKIRNVQEERKHGRSHTQKQGQIIQNAASRGYCKETKVTIINRKMRRAIWQHRDNTVLKITRQRQGNIGSLLNVISVTAYGGLEIELHGFLTL